MNSDLEKQSDVEFERQVSSRIEHYTHLYVCATKSNLHVEATEYASIVTGLRRQFRERIGREYIKSTEEHR